VRAQNPKESDAARRRAGVGSVPVPGGSCHEMNNVRADGKGCPVFYRCFSCRFFTTDFTQRAVALIDRGDQPVELAAGEPHLAASHRLVAGGGGPAGTAFSQQRRAGQVVVVHGRIEDGPKQRQVGVDGPRLEALGDHRRLPRADGAGVQLAHRDVPEDGQDALLDHLSGGVLRAWVLILPGWPPLGAHVLPEQRAGLPRVGVGQVGKLLAVAALDRPLGGQRPTHGREDPRRALPPAVLVAHPIALVGVPGGGWDGHDPGHVECLPCRRSLAELRPAVLASSCWVLAEEASENIARLTGRLTTNLTTS
jgi:hypothetical protein